jgi:hypothetical protein
MQPYYQVVAKAVFRVALVAAVSLLLVAGYMLAHL